MDSLLSFFVLAEKMKTVKRDNMLSNGEYDSDADHSWMLCLMVLVFHSKLKTKVNVERALKIAIVHDLAEAKIGDIPLCESIDNIKVQIDKKEAEEAAIREICAMLSPEIGDDLFGAWQEYEENATVEAKFVKALDKIEATFQALMYHDIRYWEKYGDGRIYYDIVLNDRKNKHWEHEPILAEVAEELKKMTKAKMREAGLDPEEFVMEPSRESESITE
jgi:Predicted hydrolases of HD superfamily